MEQTVITFSDFCSITYALEERIKYFGDHEGADRYRSILEKLEVWAKSTFETPLVCVK